MTAVFELLHTGGTAVTGVPREVIRAVTFWVDPTSIEVAETRTSTASGSATLMESLVEQAKLRAIADTRKTAMKVVRVGIIILYTVSGSLIQCLPANTFDVCNRLNGSSPLSVFGVFTDKA
jgi:hypothetical protein